MAKGITVVLVIVIVAVGAFFLTNKSPVEAKDLVHKINEGPLKISLNLSGTIESEQTSRVKYRPELYDGELVITEIVEEGKEVAKDDVIMKLDMTKIQIEIGDKNIALQSAKNNLIKAQEELKIQESSNKSMVEKAELELEISNQKLAQYEKIDKPKKIREAKLGVKNAADRVTDLTVELQQLEKMYKEDEMIEMTEELVIARAKRNLASAKESLEIAKKTQELVLEFDLPTEEKRLKLDARQKQSEYDRTQATAKANIAQKNSEINKAQAEVSKLENDLAKLGRDKNNMTIKAPVAGKIYYGEIRSSNYYEFSMGIEFKVGGKVSAHSTLMTIPELAKLKIKVNVFEADINKLKTGMQVSIYPDALSNTLIKGEVKKIKHVASRTSWYSDENTFETEIDITDNDDRLKPGMKARVEIVVDQVPNAILAPISAVHEKDGKTFCYIKNGDKFSTKEVKIGKTDNKDVEILSGLSKGETVLLYDPYRRNE